MSKGISISGRARIICGIIILIVTVVIGIMVKSIMTEQSHYEPAEIVVSTEFDGLEWSDTPYTPPPIDPDKPNDSPDYVQDNVYYYPTDVEDVHERVPVDDRVKCANLYLAGTPMEGLGQTIVDAADTYGVDWRSTCAIARLESGCGASMFLPFNAWGWGQYSWGSWEEAIYQFTEGFYNGYGSALSESGAQRYCPTNENYLSIYDAEMIYISSFYNGG